MVKTLLTERSLTITRLYRALDINEEFMAIKKVFYIAVHPGEVLQDILDESGITQVELARHIGVPQSKLNEICRGRRGVSPVMAFKLARAFSQSPEFWMGLQQEWSLSQVDQSEYKSVVKIKITGDRAA
jgi:addiction module HigA family antidote